MSLWMARGGPHGEQEQVGFENGLACIGFHAAPDLSRAKSRDDIVGLLEQGYPDAAEATLRNWARQLYAFAHRMQEGDLLAMPLRNRPHIAHTAFPFPSVCHSDRA